MYWNRLDFFYVQQVGIVVSLDYTSLLGILIVRFIEEAYCKVEGEYFLKDQWNFRRYNSRVVFEISN
jgi:hypothetical protein